MRYIIREFLIYRPRYDEENKIFHLYGKVKVKDFMTIRRLIKKFKIEVNDIRVN